MQLQVIGCWGPYPAAGQATSGYLLTEGDSSLLLDCGSGVFSRLLSTMDPSTLSAICLTHLHYDHMCDLSVMQYYLQHAGVSVPLYFPHDHESISREMLDSPAYQLFEYAGEHRFGAFTLTTAPTVHPVPCCALKIKAGGKTLVYTGDAANAEALIDFCEDADFLLADGAFTQKQWTSASPHMSAAMAAQLAKDARVKKLMITHFPPYNVPDVLLEEARKVFACTDMARAGARVVL